MTELPCATALLLAGMLGATPAAAQQEGVAEALFRQAREEMKHGEPESACPKFEESYRLDPSIGTLLNLGLCEEALGHTATAWTKLRQFLDAAPADDGRLRLAQGEMSKLEKQLPWVRLIVDLTSQQLTIQLDGVELRNASLSEAIPVNPGTHSVRIRLSSGETNETRFQIQPAERLDLRLFPPPRAAHPEPAPLSPSPPGPRTEQAAASAAVSRTPTPNHVNVERVAAYTLGAVGVAGLVTGSVFGLMAVSDRNTVKEHCPNHECRDRAGLDAAQSGLRNETIANIAFVAGAFGLVSGAALLWHSNRASAALSLAPNSASLSLVGVIQ